jgi:2-polyprenyl-6-methoxyphenol hydroxylase-like FAD-dependent oxidoreductase
MAERKILIVGAGIGGLGAAAALANAGHEVDVVEIKPEPNVYGVGINQPANSLRALQKIGVLDDVLDAGFQFTSWVFHDANANLVVAFDGINSPLRKRLYGEASNPVYTGFAVWRVTVPRPDELAQGALYQAVGAKGGHIPLSPDTMYLLLVVAEPPHVRYEQADLPDMLRERLAPFTGPLGEIRDALTDDADVVYSPLSEVLLPIPWFKDRVLICGDAAHACTPHLTQGAAMALEDAVVLVDELAVHDHLADALHAFGERRFPRVKLVQDVSRGILNSEMAITAENIDAALEHMREALPGQMGGVDDILNQSA